MSVLTNLLRCYEYCENEGLVDVHNGDTVLLPVYLQSISILYSNSANNLIQHFNNFFPLVAAVCQKS